MSKQENRQQYWLEKGYTQEQIDKHLEWERYKSKQSRERRKKNNEKNKDLISQIKKDLLGEVFISENAKKKIKVLQIRPSVDGKGFWYSFNIEFSDDSEGDFRQFYYFEDYNKEEFIENLFL